MWILDTDHLSVLEWKDSRAGMALVAKMAKHKTYELVTTIVNFEEQMRGWMSFVAKARKMTEQIEGYRRLKRQLDLYRSVILLPFDEHAAVQLQRLRKEHPRVGIMDLKVAAIALVNRAILLTRNASDFGQIPELVIENWTND